MAQVYQVKVVGKSEWERLRRSDPRYGDVNENTMGFADPVKRRGYVRDTYVPALNRYLINHEFEHLLEEKGTDEDSHGIRQKNAGEVFRNVAAVSLAPFTGGLSLSAGTDKFRGEAADVIPDEIRDRGSFGGIPTLRPESGFKQAFQRSLPAIMTAGAALGGINSFASGPMAGKALPLATQAPGGAGLSTAPASPGGGALAGLKAGAGGASKIPLLPGTAAGGGGGGWGFPGASQILQQATKSGGLNTLGGGAAAASPAAAAPAAKAGLSLGGAAKGIGVGVGLSSIGDIFGKKPQAPDFGSIPSVQELQKTVGGQGLSPLGQLGQQQLTSRLQQPFGGLEGGVESSIRDTFGQQRRNLISQFKAIRPNADLTTDSAYRQALFELDQQESQAVGTAKQNAFNQFQSTRTQDIAQALGVDNQSVETLANLAQLDIATIMAQLGVDAAEAQQFKQTWSNIGTIGALGTMGAFA